MFIKFLVNRMARYHRRTDFIKGVFIMFKKFLSLLVICGLLFGSINFCFASEKKLNPISWKTDTVQLSADDFYITVSGQKFVPNTTTTINSDPGNPNYTTLEVVWVQNGIEMRMNFYFSANSTHYWITEIRVYNGKKPAEWITLKTEYWRNNLGRKVEIPNNYSIRMKETSSIHFKNLKLSVNFLTEVEKLKIELDKKCKIENDDISKIIKLTKQLEEANKKIERLEYLTSDEIIISPTNGIFITDDNLGKWFVKKGMVVVGKYIVIFNKGKYYSYQNFTDNYNMVIFTEDAIVDGRGLKFISPSESEAKKTLNDYFPNQSITKYTFSTDSTLTRYPPPSGYTEIHP